jgi:integration host factor subunit alpha
VRWPPRPRNSTAPDCARNRVQQLGIAILESGPRRTPVSLYRQGRKINNNDVETAVLQSALDAELHSAMLVAKVRKEAEKDMPTLTKAELAELLFEQVGLNKREAKDMVETFFDEIRNALERGEAVKLSGFGNFQLRDKPQRPGRNPKTGEEIPITARRVVTFHASQKLKSMVEESNPLARAA